MKAIARLMWPSVKMSLTPPTYIVNSTKMKRKEKRKEEKIKEGKEDRPGSLERKI